MGGEGGRKNKGKSWDETQVQSLSPLTVVYFFVLIAGYAHVVEMSTDSVM